MRPARPLHDILTEVTGAGAGDPAGALADGGHGDLPDALVAEAIVSYADTAPVEVAEHLAPFVQGHSAVPPADPAAPVAGVDQGLALLATAPVPVPAEAEPEPAPPAGDQAAEAGSGAGRDPEVSGGHLLDLAFGEGGSEGDFGEGGSGGAFGEGGSGGAFGEGGSGGGLPASGGPAGPDPFDAGRGGVDEPGLPAPGDPGDPGELGSAGEPGEPGVGPDPADLFPPAAPPGAEEADLAEPGAGG